MSETSAMLIVKLQAKIDGLEEKHEENADKILKLEQRIAGYDILAAKWGGVLMVSVALGTGMLTFWEKIRSFAAWMSRQ